MSWHARFDALVRRKTQRASVASLSPYRTECDAPDAGMAAVGNAWTRRLFDGPFYASSSSSPRRPSCSLVFVQDAAGNTGASDPSQLGGGDTDTHLIYEGLSRVAADAVMAGAGTLRVSDAANDAANDVVNDAGHAPGGEPVSDVVFSVWHPELVALRASLGLPRHPVQIVATLQGLDLDGALIFNVPEIPVLLLTVGAAAVRMRRAISLRPWITPILMRDPVDLPDAFAQMRSVGIARISCVGGHTLADHLLAARLVDEVYLTTAPSVSAEPDTPISHRPWRGRTIVRKHGTGDERSVLFEHVSVR